MADFPSATPPSLVEIEAYCRFWLGNLSESQMTSADMQVLIAMNIGKYGEDNCKITYYSMLDILRWLIREQAKGSSGSGGGAGTYQKKIQEKVGKRERTIEYGIDTSGATAAVASGFDKILEDLLANPSTIGCNPIDSGTGGEAGGSVIIGVSKDRFDMATPWRENQNRTNKYRF